MTDLPSHVTGEIITRIISDLGKQGISVIQLQKRYFYCPFAEVSGKIENGEIQLTDHLVDPKKPFDTILLKDAKVFEKVVRIILDKRQEWDAGKRGVKKDSGPVV